MLKMKKSIHHINFEPRTAIKSQVLADFVVDWTGPTTQPDQSAEKIWTIHYDGAWCHAGAGAAAVITSLVGAKHRYAARLSFALESDRCTNNIAEYEAVILGLRKLRALGVTTCIIVFIFSICESTKNTVLFLVNLHKAQLLLSARVNVK